MITICEIFASIQGESTLQGLPCVFVRLSGCNLNCRYCDTRYARENGTEMSKEEIVKKVDEFELSFVCITGGEPLTQKETPILAQDFIGRGYRVSLETNGTIDASGLHEDVIRIIDIKCPGSGEHGKTHSRNISNRRSKDEFKFVLTDRTDFEYARDFVRKHSLDDTCTVLLSPVHDVLDPQLLADWIMQEMPGARLNLQLHKYIWPEEKRR
jgi:7-carboxy-7-deazaguanine synthase